MSDRTSFELNPRTLRCEEWEALLADALDGAWTGALTASDRAGFERHTRDCQACATMLDEARKGQQWLQFLHPEPPVPHDLMQRILARTGGTVSSTLPAGAGTPPSLPLTATTAAWARFPVPAGMRRFVEPRLMMTAAMAFFSIALTLNLAGVRLAALRGQDLRPSVLRSNLERQFYTAGAPVVRYYENLRVVYEVESRMRELRRTTTESDDSRAVPRPEPEKAPAVKDGGGSARKNGGKSESPRTTDSRTIFAGRPLEARLHGLQEGWNRLAARDLQIQKLQTQELQTQELQTVVWADSLFPKRADQAERSLA